jgi:hypothetical protein
MRGPCRVARKSLAWNAVRSLALKCMAPDPNDFIQDQIHLHGRLRAARYLTCSEYSIEHEDGFAYVVTDPRAEADGPIRSVELTHGRDQMLNVDFEQRMTSQRFLTIRVLIFLR